MRVVVDLVKAHKSVSLVCGVQRGSVPHSPDLGVDWLAVLDEPQTSATLRKLHLDIDQQFRIHLPELKFISVTFLSTPMAGKTRARVKWAPADSISNEQETAV